VGGASCEDASELATTILHTNKPKRLCTLAKEKKRGKTKKKENGKLSSSKYRACTHAFMHPNLGWYELRKHTSFAFFLFVFVFLTNPLSHFILLAPPLNFLLPFVLPNSCSVCMLYHGCILKREEEIKGKKEREGMEWEGMEWDRLVIDKVLV
jgi:hypothetical protein